MNIGVLKEGKGLSALVKRSLYFIVFFCLIKASSFVAPLLSSNVSGSLEAYGNFEFGLTFGLVASIIIDFGGNGGYPFFFFNRRIGEQEFPEFFFHYIPIATLFVLMLWLSHFFSLAQLKYEIGMVVTLALGMQTRLSAIFKTKNRVFLSVLADGMLFILINVYNAYLYITGNTFDLLQLFYVLGIYAAVLTLCYTAAFVYYKSQFSFSQYRSILKWGSRLVISAFLMISLTGSARIIAEHFIGTEAVGQYGFFFRLASFVVLLHQAINIFFFKNMYTASPEKLNKYFSVFLVSVAVIAIGVWLTAPVVLNNYLKLLQLYNSNDKLLFFVLSAHVFFWISIALYENVVYREDVAGQMNILFFVITLGFVLTCYSLYSSHNLDTITLAIVNVICLFCCTEAQYFCLKQKGIALSLVQKANRLCFIIFSIIYAGLVI